MKEREALTLVSLYCGKQMCVSLVLLSPVTKENQFVPDTVKRTIDLGLDCLSSCPSKDKTVARNGNVFIVRWKLIHLTHQNKSFCTVTYRNVCVQWKPTSSLGLVPSFSSLYKLGICSHSHPPKLCAGHPLFVHLSQGNPGKVCRFHSQRLLLSKSVSHAI